MLFSFATAAQDVRIRVVKPRIKASDNVNNLGNQIHGSIKRAVANIKDYVSLIDREIEEELSISRETLKRNSGVASSAMVGANYILETKISDIRMSYDSVQVVKDKGKSKKWLFRCNVGFTCNLELVSVETGETTVQQSVNVKGYAFELINYIYLFNREKLFREALVDQRECFETLIQYMILQAVPVKTPVISISESKKNEAKKLLLKGGRFSPVRSGLKYDVVKVYTQRLGGKEVQREEKIGELKHDNTYEHYTECKVKKGKKEIFAAIEAGDKLYARTKDLKPKDTCDGFLAAGYRAARNAAYKSARAEDPAPSKTKNTKSSKSKSKKKVRRKSN